MAAPIKKTAPKAAPKGHSYTIKRGDTLAAIAKREGTTVAAIAKQNHITDPNKIRAGGKLSFGEPFRPPKAPPTSIPKGTPKPPSTPFDAPLPGPKWIGKKSAPPIGSFKPTPQPVLPKPTFSTGPVPSGGITSTAGKLKSSGGGW